MNKSLQESYLKVLSSLGGDIEKAKETLKDIEAEQSKGVTDAMHTGNTGFGAEMTQNYIYKDELYSMIVQDKLSLLSFLPGNHGEVNAPSVLVSVKGRVEKFKQSTQYTGSAAFFAGVQQNNAMATARLTLPIAKFKTMVSISKEELQYSTDRGLFATVQNAIVRGGRETITNVIINGDTQTNTATGNVNQKDNGTGTALADQCWLAIGDGLRHLGLANGLIGGAVAHDSNIYKQMLSLLGDYSAEPQDLLWILSSKTGLSARYVPGYRTLNEYGPKATVETPGTPAMIEGIQTFQTREMAKLVGVDGYVYEGTAETGATAKNLYGQLLCIYKPAVQYAFGMPMQTVLFETSDAFLIDVSMWFGFIIANQAAGLDKTVAMAVVA